MLTYYNTQLRYSWIDENAGLAINCVNSPENAVILSFKSSLIVLTLDKMTTL